MLAGDSLADPGAEIAEPSGDAVYRGLKIRPFEERDRERAKELLKQHHENTVFRSQPFSEWKYNEQANRILTRPPLMLCLVACWNNEIVGGVWAHANGYMLSDGPLFVTVNIIAVDLEMGKLRRAKTFIGLVAAVRHWAGTLNASHSFIHVTTGSYLQSTDRLMKAAGAKLIGGTYVV